MRALAICLALLPAAALGESLVALRTMPAGTVIGPGDVGIAAEDHPGAVATAAAAIGQEARVALYAGRPVLAQNIGPPAIVDRNQMVMLVYQRGPLTIVADGRALGRGAAGDMVRVMNLGSRNTVSGVILPDGTIHVATTALAQP
ncbi:flagella basal body P-ring formation protein FlgA [Rhodobacteraceae bacterium MBR-64]